MSGLAIPQTRAELSYEFVYKIAPSWIELFDKFQLPRAIPLLELSFALKCGFPRVVDFIPNKYLHAVSSGESWDDTILVFPITSGKIVSHANVQSTVSPARQNVHKETHAGCP